MPGFNVAGFLKLLLWTLMAKITNSSYTDVSDCFTLMSGHNAKGGDLQDPSVYDSVKKCEFLCVKTPSCTAFDFNKHYAACFLHHREVAPQRYSSHVDHYVKTPDDLKLLACEARVQLKINNKKPAFSAGLSQRLSLTESPNMTVVWDDVCLNDAGGYNDETGVFIAPLPGSYFFTANLRSPRGTLASAHMMVNNEVFHSIWANGRNTGDHGVGSGTMAVQLEEGDRVFLLLFQHYGYVYLDPGYSRFTGHMIS